MEWSLREPCYIINYVVIEYIMHELGGHPYLALAWQGYNIIQGRSMQRPG